MDRYVESFRPEGLSVCEEREWEKRRRVMCLRGEMFRCITKSCSQQWPCHFLQGV